MQKKCEKIECELECKATASLNEVVLADFHKKDKDLLDLLKDEDDSEDTTKPVD